MKLKSLYVSGFKSFAGRDRALRADQSLEFGDITVLLGANGSGKSNLVSLFQLLERLAEGRLQTYLDLHGGNSLLHFGPRWTQRMQVDIGFADESHSTEYHLTLAAGAGETLKVVDESYGLTHAGGVRVNLGPDTSEVRDGGDPDLVAIASLLRGITTFQFHDTSASSDMRRGVYIEDGRQLRSNGGNLAAFLQALRTNHAKHYDRIRRTIQQVCPAFDDFVLGASVVDPAKIFLNWRSRDQDDYLMRPEQIADGTLRFMALATLLLQPTETLPSTIVLDEPELGLHPTAIAILAAMIHQAAEHRQIVLATQSPTLVDHFDLSQIRPMAHTRGASTFLPVDVDALEDWLEDYSLGEIWQKNLFRAGPEHV